MHPLKIKDTFRILKNGKISMALAAMLASASIVSLVVPTNSYSAPGGGSVVAGSATINQSGTVTNINQSSNKAVINWNSFGVAKNESVNFNQPSINSVTLNRVIGNENL